MTLVTAFAIISLLFVVGTLGNENPTPITPPRSCDALQCPAGDLCCQDVTYGALCYSNTSYSCLLGSVGPVLCGFQEGHADAVCKTVCYDPCDFVCCNDVVYGKEDPSNPCTQPSTTQPPTTRPPTTKPPTTHAPTTSSPISCANYVCPAGDSCCDDITKGPQCYDPNTATCLPGPVLCGNENGHRDQACNTTCYDPTGYVCCDLVLYQINNAPCTGSTTHPATTHPATTKPPTTHPATTQRETTHPATTKPATTHPATTQHETTKPATTHPATTQHETTKPATTHPVTTQRETTKPATTQRETTKPATTQRETTKPATTQRETTKPATTQPATTKPGTTHPATTHPATTKPGTTHPATTHAPTTSSPISCVNYVCPAGDSCCDDITKGPQCYNNNTATCLPGPVLCGNENGHRDQACNTTCYDPTDYVCCDLVLYQIGNAPCTVSTTHPATTHPATTHPATTQHETTKPATTHPATTHPATTQHETTKPATTHPATTQRETTKPATTHPATTRPAGW